MSSLELVALEFLGQLERREAALLSWGMVDGFFSENEIYDFAEEFLDRRTQEAQIDTFRSADDLIQWLLDRVLLWSLPLQEARYRTRMAEGIRFEV